MPFSDHVALLIRWLDRRREIVEAVEARLLNVQGKPASRSRDRASFERTLDACFVDFPDHSLDVARLKGQLAAAHRADGFEPIPLGQFSHELDPLELIGRAYEHWDSHRWPGKAGRLTYAQTIYVVYMLRRLEWLSLRVWDEGHESAAERLQDVTRLLDRLNAPPPAAPPTTTGAFIRDARWLIQTAQGPLTRQLGPYFTVAQHVSNSFTPSERLEIHKAGAKLAGGHLRSQLRYAVWRSQAPADDPDVLAFTRNSNSMDNALLLRDLVALLEAYQAACTEEDVEKRLDLADAIFQGWSADPELFLSRLDLLAPYTMVEGLFVHCGDDGRAQCTAMGEEHRSLLERYGGLVANLCESLQTDASRYDPSEAVYSPYGIVYGFVADVLSNMAMDTLLSQPSRGLSLEDMYVSRGSLEEKLARARAWEQLPKREGEREHFEHAAEWAAQVWTRLRDALDARVRHKAVPNASSRPDAKLWVVPESESVETLPAGFLPATVAPAPEYYLTSDVRRSMSGAATVYPKDRIVADRNEGRYLASVEINGKWFALSKIVLTVVTAQGRHALFTDVPQQMIDVLRLTCPGLLVLPPAMSAKETF